MLCIVLPYDFPWVLYAIELPHFAAMKAHSAERFMNFDCYIKRPNPVYIYIHTSESTYMTEPYILWC